MHINCTHTCMYKLHVHVGDIQSVIKSLGRACSRLLRNSLTSKPLVGFCYLIALLNEEGKNTRYKPDTCILVVTEYNWQQLHVIRRIWTFYFSFGLLLTLIIDFKLIATFNICFSNKRSTPSSFPLSNTLSYNATYM